MAKREGWLCGVLGLLALVGPSCSGTETDNPVVEFEASDCKKGVSQNALIIRSAGRPADGLELQRVSDAGLYCFAWAALQSGLLRIDVINMPGSCGVEWAPGPTEHDAGGLVLSVQNNHCAVAGCGNCAYDLSFRVAGIAFNDPLPLELRQLDCEGKPIR